eukprot:gene14849-10618_t
MIRGLSLAVFLVVLTRVFGQVTVRQVTQYIYDKSENLRIRGSGFDANDHDILLDLGSAGQPSLVADKVFMISKDSNGDGLILKLLGNRRWANLSQRTPPVAIILNGVRFASDPKKNLLPAPVIVAQVLNTPSVKENTNVLFKSASKELRINGTGFVGSGRVDLYFQPPLTKEVAYEDVTPYPLRNDQIVLRLRHGFNWRDASGPLYVIGVDTGGGPIKLNGDDGIQVADVQEN